MIIRESENDHLASAIEWLCPDFINIANKLNDELLKCERSRPTWVLEQAEYQQWISSPSEEPTWLWALGRPGAGKTFFVSFVADGLRDLEPIEEIPAVSQLSFDEGAPSTPRKRDSFSCGTCIAIFYCSHQITYKQDANSIVKAICGQYLHDLQNADPWRARARSKLVDRLRHPQASVRTAEPVSALDLLKTLVYDFRHP